MHQRKAEMAHHSDCFTASSGGYGTLEELLKVITWAQLGIHDKPMGLLNVDGYYNHLLTFIEKTVDNGFIKPSQHHIIVFAPNAREPVQKLKEYVFVHTEIVVALPPTVQSQLCLEPHSYNAMPITPNLHFRMAMHGHPGVLPQKAKCLVFLILHFFFNVNNLFCIKILFSNNLSKFRFSKLIFETSIFK
ncbi:hypothetical protein VitviT2T_017905 [Vitis vinifera]|uniref:Cytokinin riboside 5'-monophosphate phosphoribohydrolase n=1 Tax=Vitis vinifera TaxID=29760 RepID=A0ABY9CY67_VITVI|nr:hypothetical protein VitviT2T_017905 [Vitis vinifera]